ncbi:hypothetical protein EV424DRAFT_1345798 [Suillus variegatus]|nr:hypothetical protein EV424DRAFT_1345798 [Suillus variegatus]
MTRNITSNLPLTPFEIFLMLPPFYVRFRESEIARLFVPTRRATNADQSIYENDASEHPRIHARCTWLAVQGPGSIKSWTSYFVWRRVACLLYGFHNSFDRLANDSLLAFLARIQEIPSVVTADNFSRENFATVRSNPCDNLQALTSNDASQPPRIQGVGPIFFGSPALHMGALRGSGSISAWTSNLFLRALHAEQTDFINRLAVLLAVNLSFLAVPGNPQYSQVSRDLSNYLNLSDPCDDVRSLKLVSESEIVQHLQPTRPFMKTMPSDPHRIRSAYPILFDPLTAHTTAYEGRLDETAEFPIH